MDAIECLVTRRSIRNYTKEPVSAGDIENVVEIAQMVSCWENTQPVRYVAVLDNDPVSYTHLTLPTILRV